MRRWVVGLIAVALIAPQALGWLPETHRLVCEQAAASVWGADAVAGCFTGGEPAEWDAFCAEYMPSPKVALACMNYSAVYHPSVLADRLLNDTAEHLDFTVCPIKSQADYRYVCADAGYAPAKASALAWFEKSADSKSLCPRIYAFCVGSNYLADARLPTNQFTGGYGSECASEIEGGVERKITEKDNKWEVNARCSIPYQRKLAGQTLVSTLKQQFRITQDSIRRITEELSGYGMNISVTAYVTTTSTTSTTTSSTSTSTSSSSTSTTLTPPSAQEEKGGGFTKALLVLLVVAAACATAYYLKGRQEKGGGKRRPHALLSSSEHTHPTHLERA